MSDDQINATLEGSIYSVSEAASQAITADLNALTERVRLLRENGRLCDETLRRYYGTKRFQQVAESNAIEGSTLSAGETELAVLKGVTLTGHDPAHVRDAVSLDKALQHLVEMARRQEPTDISQVKEFHELLFEARAGAGMFRQDPVRISGSPHRPPKTWHQIMENMEAWESWSQSRADTNALLRAAVLHAWLVQIHPFSDGNGRTARAVSNLELIRRGFPPVIIRRRQDRDRYIHALRMSDKGGDIAEFLDLLNDRFKGALLGLELAASEIDGYNPAIARIREAQRRKLGVWNKSVELLHQMLVDRLSDVIEAAHGVIRTRLFSDSLELDDYLELCQGCPVTRSWAFELTVSIPGMQAVERLAWVGYRSRDLRTGLGDTNTTAPALFWSKRNPAGYPPWIQSAQDAPGVKEMSITPGKGDEWSVLGTTGDVDTLSTTELAERLTSGFLDLMD